MNWAELILTGYAVLALAALLLLVADEAFRRRRVSAAGTAEALFCAAIWPVIAWCAAWELVRMARRKCRP